MKTYVLIASLIIILTSQYKLVKCKKMNIEEMKDMLRPMSKSCKTKTGASQELIQATHNGEFPKDKSLMCYFRCLSIMLKLMNKGGVIKPKDIDRQIDLLVNEEFAPKLKAVFRSCYEKTKPSEDSCEYAYDIVVCGYNTDSSIYFLP